MHIKCDVVYMGGYTPLAMAVAGLICYLRRVPFGWINESHLLKPRSRFTRAVKEVLLRRIIQPARASLAVSSPSKHYLVHYGADRDSVYLFPNTCDVEHLDMAVKRAQVRRPEISKRFGLSGNPAVLFIGRLAPEKNLDVLLKAWQHVQEALPRAELLIVGEGPDAERLRRSARVMGLTSVRWAGWLQPDEIPDALAVSDCFVLPSRDEPFGVVVTEAMAAGLPVVVSDHVGAAEDLVANGRTGFVFPVDDELALKDILITLLGAPDLLASIGAEARRAVSHWNYDMAVANFISSVRRVWRTP